MKSKLYHLNLNEILDRGLDGKIPSLTQDDWKFLGSLMISIATFNGLIDEIKPVQQVIEDIITEAGALLDRLNGLVVN